MKNTPVWTPESIAALTPQQEHDAVDDLLARLESETCAGIDPEDEPAMCGYFQRVLDLANQLDLFPVRLMDGEPASGNAVR